MRASELRQGICSLRQNARLGRSNLGEGKREEKKGRGGSRTERTRKVESKEGAWESEWGMWKSRVPSKPPPAIQSPRKQKNA